MANFAETRNLLAMGSDKEKDLQKKPRFINMLTDAGFKHVFGQPRYKDLLIAFLNRLFNGEKVVTDVVYHDKEMLSLFNDNKTLIYDVYCTTPLEEHFIVEMQCEPQDYFQSRALVYGSRAIVEQTKRGKEWNYGDLKAVYIISILNFKMEDLPNVLKSSASIRNDEGKHETINPLLRFINIQLPYTPKSLDACETNLERWVYIIKNSEKMEEIPETLKETMAEMGRFEEAASVTSMTKEEYAVYERSLKHYRDRIGTLSYYERRNERAREEGREEGREEMIRIMASKGMPMDAIANFTGFTPDQIHEILKG